MNDKTMKATGTIEKPEITIKTKFLTRKERLIVIVAMILKQDIDIYRGRK